MAKFQVTSTEPGFDSQCQSSLVGLYKFPEPLASLVSLPALLKHKNEIFVMLKGLLTLSRTQLGLITFFLQH